MSNLKKICNSLLLTTIICFGWVEATLKFSSRDSTIKLKNSSAQLRLETPMTGYNGTLKIEGKTNNSVQGLTGSDKITFAEGVLASGANNFVITGVLNPTTGDTIELGDNQTIEASAGDVIQSITISGTTGADSVIKGQPIFGSAIVINGSTNFLKLGIQNKLTQNVTMNGGTLTLVDDLSLLDGVKFTGNGTVDVGNYTLELATTIGSPWTGNLTFKNANDIQLNGYTELTGIWDFNDVSGSSQFNGNGNVLDLSSGGTIAVAEGHTLYLSDVHVKGLGSGLGDFNIHPTGGRVKMSNVTFELGATYTHSTGEFYVQGDNCRVISADTTSGNYSFNVTGTVALITVDHSVLEYETLGGQNISPFTFANVGTQRNLVNGGVLRSATLDNSVGNIIFDEAAVSPVLSTNYDITSATNIVFTNIATGAQTMTLDGQGYFLQFPAGAANMFQIAADLTLTLEDVVLKDFNAAVVSYGANSALQFGDGCVIELAADTVIGAASKPFTFVGNATLIGYGHTITLQGASNRMTVAGAKTLKIRDTKIYIDHVNALSCLSYDAKFDFKNVDICIANPGFAFALGSIDINGDVKIKGCDATTPGGLALFNYSTTGTLTVQRASTLELKGDLNFTYLASPAPSVTPTAATYAQSKRRLKLIDPSATLHLNACTLTSTGTALALDYGNLIVEDTVAFNISAAAGSEAEIGTALDVAIKAGATLEVGGPLKYTSTTYP